MSWWPFRLRPCCFLQCSKPIRGSVISVDSKLARKNRETYFHVRSTTNAQTWSEGKSCKSVIVCAATKRPRRKTVIVVIILYRTHSAVDTCVSSSSNYSTCLEQSVEQQRRISKLVIHGASHTTISPHLDGLSYKV